MTIASSVISSAALMGRHRSLNLLTMAGRSSLEARSISATDLISRSTRADITSAKKSSTPSNASATAMFPAGTGSSFFVAGTGSLLIVDSPHLQQSHDGRVPILRSPRRRTRLVGPAPLIKPGGRVLGVLRLLPHPLGRVAHGTGDNLLRRRPVLHRALEGHVGAALLLL